MLKTIYAAFNMLLREDIGMGSLKQGEMKESEREGCRCDNQIIKSECSVHMILESEAIGVRDTDNSHQTPNYCNRTFPFKCLIENCQLNRLQQALHTNSLSSPALQPLRSTMTASRNSSSQIQTPTNPFPSSTPWDSAPRFHGPSLLPLWTSGYPSLTPQVATCHFSGSGQTQQGI